MSEDKDTENTMDAFKNVKECSTSTSSDESDGESLNEHCSDATYLARIIISDEKPTQRDSIKLFNLKVRLRHKVPPQHEIETRAGSHMPSRDQIKKFEEITTLKRGTYSVNEDCIIINNWKTFCKLHDWNMANPRPFMQLRVGTTPYIGNIKERRKFVQFLAENLPNRTLYSVYHRFKTLYERNEQGRYKPEEDEMIINHLENNPSLDERRKYADLAKTLHRTRNSIWRRYRILKHRNIAR